MLLTITSFSEGLKEVGQIRRGPKTGVFPLGEIGIFPCLFYPARKRGKNEQSRISAD